MRWMTIHNTQEENPDEEMDQPESMSGMSAEQDLAPVTNIRPTVGDELRMRREEAGHTIHEVAEAVRVQRRYLEALESGRLEDLPGTVYALGFLRTYAEHYGLNGDEFVTRFKEETEGQRQKQDYSLPEPLEEARVPTAAIVIVAIVLAIGAYVAWYSMRSQDAEISGAVPEVPAHLASVAEETAPAPASTPTPTETVVVPQPATAVEPVEPVAVTEAAIPPAPEPLPAEVETAVIPVAPAEPEALPIEAPPAVEIAAVAPPETPETDTPLAPVVEDTPYEPQAFGGNSAEVRIVITAAEDSWLEVTNAEGDRLFSRTMRAGDSYRVPNREGLVFVTGNAGGLEITVDGAATPAIGDSGIVRKNVKLDPELLKQGRAWP